MVFCIDKEKCEKLSDYLSQIIKILKEQDEVDAIFMNSYLIHIPVNSPFTEPDIIDGINIRLTIICNVKIDETTEIKELKEKVLDELNYNVLVSYISKETLMMKSDLLKFCLNDADIIFDKTGDVTMIKNAIFLFEKCEDAITYEPSLNIRS